MEEETTNNEDNEQYFEDMQEDFKDLPEINFRGYGLGVPRTRFTDSSIWD